MSGKFLNTTYHDTVENITNFYNDLVNNPFYLFNDKRAVTATYYNINKQYSSLDPGSKLAMDNNGSESPIRYNRIYDFLLYGFNKVELNTTNDEYGLEADKIEGECYILPNTIIPTEGDYFEIEHIKDSTWLFIVNDTQKDTLDNGSNVYKISYNLEYHDNVDIQSRIVHNFRFIEYKEGTNIGSIIRCEDYDIAKRMNDISVELKDYFIDLFYNDKVQTFIYSELTEYRVYDPFMIEFLIRNDVLENNENYHHLFINHQLSLPRTFGIDYDKSFYRAFEKKDKNIDNYYTECCIKEIDSYGTTFNGRYESYYKAIYNSNDYKYYYHVNTIGDDIIDRIINNKIFDDKDINEEDNNLWMNIVIKYFNNGVVTDDELKSLEDIDLTSGSAKQCFFTIPCIIFCLDRFIENVLK